MNEYLPPASFKRQFIGGGGGAAYTTVRLYADRKIRLDVRHGGFQLPLWPLNPTSVQNRGSFVSSLRPFAPHLFRLSSDQTNKPVLAAPLARAQWGSQAQLRRCVGVVWFQATSVMPDFLRLLFSLFFFFSILSDDIIYCPFLCRLTTGSC